MEIITNESPNEIIYEQFLFYFIYFLTLSFHIEGLRRSQTWTICRNKCHGCLRRSVDFGSFRSHLFYPEEWVILEKLMTQENEPKLLLLFFKKVYLFANIPWNLKDSLKLICISDIFLSSFLFNYFWLFKRKFRCRWFHCPS